MRRIVGIAALAGVLGTSGMGVALAKGPDANGPAKFGLCTAWAANANGREHGNAENAPPFQNLQSAADAQDQTVEEFCNGVTPGNR